MDSWVASCLGAPEPVNRDDLERIRPELFNREILEKRQLELLNGILCYAREKSSFYRERFPDKQITSFAEFADLPFTTPEDLCRRGYEMVCTGADEIGRIVTLMETSGSEGLPKRVYFTPADQERTVDFFHHGMMEFAVPGDRALLLFPGNSPGSLNVLLTEALSRMEVKARIFGFPKPEDYGRVSEEIVSGNFNRIVGPPFTIAAIAEYSEKAGMAEKTAGIVESVLLAGSFVSKQDCETIQRLWHCRIDEEYGMTETGLGGGVGCKTGGGYHLWESDLYYEVIDPDTGAPVPDGTCGELVVTTLNRQAMPFIRYRTGDRSRILPGPCACGSILKHLERVQSRPSVKKYLR